MSHLYVFKAEVLYGTKKFGSFIFSFWFLCAHLVGFLLLHCWSKLSIQSSIRFLWGILRHEDARKRTRDPKSIDITLKTSINFNYLYSFMPYSRIMSKVWVLDHENLFILFKSMLLFFLLPLSHCFSTFLTRWAFS